MNPAGQSPIQSNKTVEFYTFILLNPGAQLRQFVKQG